MVFDKVKDRFSDILGSPGEEPEYIEIDLGQEIKKNKIVVRPFILKDFDGVTDILNALREGYTIAVIDIKTLKTKDIYNPKPIII